MIAFLGIINESSSAELFSISTRARRLVSVETMEILLVEISISAPFSSNFGLLLSIAGVIFFSEEINFWF